ncbi:hypothetical protein GCM10011360_00110 [Primorskyibacter flagellatus]|uniref:AlpA family phage regulatory protein n=1 Tax=Primorskyibacter flagellatus TaxID=1387277 RepID=A0A917E8S1_9RHOB|nr:AlpA family phage regulatory protein [Primorskyibacter flagellatus]GGE15270.1 hypothetical protein GCM10011360_00110 [Primorskyibacter flagellatus]
MSKKAREPHEALDLFSVAELPEHTLPEVGNLKHARSAVRPAPTPQKVTNPTTLAEGASNERCLRDTAVAQRYGVCRQTVWRWVAQESLPEPIRLSEGVTRWRLSDLLAHEASLPKGAKAKVVRSRPIQTAKAGGLQ